MGKFNELVAFDYDEEDFKKELKKSFSDFFDGPKQNILFLNNIPTDVINKELGIVFDSEKEEIIKFKQNGVKYIYRKNVYLNTSTITRDID